MKYLLLLLTVLAGSLFPLQAGINSRCGQALGHPLWGVLVNFVGGAIFATIAVTIARPGGGFPTLARASTVPWWAWLGGLCGCTFVLIAIIAVRQLGYVGLISGLVLGQILASAVFDQTGFLREHVHPMNLGRGAGIALLVVGFWLVNRD